MNNIENNIKNIACRLADLRDIQSVSVEKMAEATRVSADEYMAHERGERDFSFTFLYNSAQTLGVDISDLLTGEAPKLSTYTVTRAGDGLSIHRRAGFEYKALAYLFKNKQLNPMMVFAPYSKEKSKGEVELSVHDGQEFDLVLSGTLKIVVNGHIEILNKGDSIYYNSSNPHGMVALNEDGCSFIAIVTGETQSKLNGGK